MIRPFVLVALLSTGLGGCSRGDRPLTAMTPEELWREKARVMHAIADAAETDGPQERFDALGKRLLDIVREEKRVSKADVFRLHEKYTPDMREALRRITAAEVKRPGVSAKLTKIKYSDK